MMDKEKLVETLKDMSIERVDRMEKIDLLRLLYYSYTHLKVVKE